VVAYPQGVSTRVKLSTVVLLAGVVPTTLAAVAPAEDLFLLLGLVVTPLLLAVAFFVWRWAGRLERLAHDAPDLVSGEATRIDIDGTDEISQLSEVLNQLAREIRNRDAKLIAWNDELEHRDSEITAWNEELQQRLKEIEEWNENLQQRVDEGTRELREAESQIAEAHRIASVSSLAAGLAHEVNNPLTGVLGLTQLLARKLEKSADTEQHVRIVRQIEQDAQRIKTTLLKLRSLTDEQEERGFERLDLNDVMTRAISAFDFDGIEVAREFENELPRVNGNPADLAHVVDELFKNARTAMNGSGRLTVTTAGVGSELVKVCVTDTGKGIEQKKIEVVFDPFFTTKDEWTGEGLGLTVAYRIIERHNGKIKLTSEVGRGTQVTITLPVAMESSPL